MSMIQFKKFLLEKQAEWGREIQIQEMADQTGISRDTISRLMNQKITRVDEKTVFALCDFFGVPKGEPIPFLIYDPN